MTTVTFEPGKLDIGQVLNQTFAVLRRNFPTFFGLALLLVGLPTALIELLRPPVISDGAAVPEFSLALIGWGLLAIGVTLATFSILYAALINATVQDLNGSKPAFADNLTVGLRNFLPVIVVSLLSSLAISGGLLLLIVPGVMIACALCVAMPAIVVEHTGIRGAFARSAELTRGHRWPIFGLFLIVIAVSIGIGIVLGIGLVGAAVVTGGLDAGAAETSPLQIAAEVVINSLIYMLSATGGAVLYSELRRLNETASAQGDAVTAD